MNEKDRERIIKEIQSRLGDKTTILENFDSEFETGCNLCGKCCRNRNDIILTVSDVRKLCKGLDISVGELASKYLEIYIGENSNLPLSIINFKEKLYGDGGTVCPFLKNKGGKYLCTVNDFKPNLCRLFPVGKVNTINPENNKSEVIYVSGEIDCLPKAEQSMFKLRDWIGTETEQDINSKWISAYADKCKRFYNICKGKENKLYSNSKLQLLVYAYFHETKIELSEDEAIKEYLNPDNTFNKSIEEVIKNILN